MRMCSFHLIEISKSRHDGLTVPRIDLKYISPLPEIKMQFAARKKIFNRRRSPKIKQVEQNEKKKKKRK